MGSSVAVAHVLQRGVQKSSSAYLVCIQLLSSPLTSAISKIFSPASHWIVSIFLDQSL